MDCVKLMVRYDSDGDKLQELRRNPVAQAHTVITYPGYRGNNLHLNGTVQQSNGLGVSYTAIWIA
jgi:hypothetical protein